MEDLKEDKKPMTKEEAQNKLVELSFIKDSLKKQYEDLDKQLEEVCTTLGVGYMFEDKDGTVFLKTSLQIGRNIFVYFNV